MVVEPTGEPRSILQGGSTKTRTQGQGGGTTCKIPQRNKQALPSDSISLYIAEPPDAKNTRGTWLVANYSGLPGMHWVGVEETVSRLRSHRSGHRRQSLGRAPRGRGVNSSWAPYMEVSRKSFPFNYQPKGSTVLRKNEIGGGGEARALEFHL